MQLILPTSRQLLHLDREFYCFIHFSLNTFTDKEWGFGDESPSIFNPTQFDADQIVSTAKATGMKGLILTCKHHDGFCLWPSKYTEHSVKNSPFRDGKGDVVLELSQACRRAGLEFGVYLSPWDRNHPDYGTPAYIDYYRAQLRELLTQYGEIFQIWFDGANGGNGWYGGANEKRKIDPTVYYDWENTWKIVRELQPNAVIFSDVGPDVRWVGNERGVAGNPCWYTIFDNGYAPGVANEHNLNSGNLDGDKFHIPECDVSIRPGWFYHETQDDQVRSLKNLIDLYFHSVGRGATFNLNLPPDRRGLIHENDVASLKQFKAHFDATFNNNLAQDATVSNHNEDTVWYFDYDLSKTGNCNVVELREDLVYGQRIIKWELEAFLYGAWQPVVSAESVGHKRLIRFAPICATKYRVKITNFKAEPMLCGFGLFFEPSIDTDDKKVETEFIKPDKAEKVDSRTIVLSFNNPTNIRGIKYLPKLDNVVSKYHIIFADESGKAIKECSGEFGNMLNNPWPQDVFCAGVFSSITFKAVDFCVGSVMSVDDVAILK